AGAPAPARRAGRRGDRGGRAPRAPLRVAGGGLVRQRRARRDRARARRGPGESRPGEGVDRLQELLARIDAATARLEGSDDPEEAVAALAELDALAQELSSEV